MNVQIYLTKVLAVWICNLSVVMATRCEEVCEYVAELQDVNCFNKNISVLPQGCEVAVTLQAGRNNIVALEGTTFTRYSRLRYLYFTNGVISEISPGTFTPVASTITVMVITVNRIQRLNNDTFVSMPLLEELDLQTNHIESIGAGAFQDIPNLTNLFLSHNRLTELPPSVFDGMPQLQNLQLQNNYLHEINSRVFFNLHSLKRVKLYHNEITSLIGNPLGVEGQSLQITQLDLSQNNLTHFDCDWIGSLTGMVNLSFNLITSVSSCRSELEFLTLINNPFDCRCESEVIAEIYKTWPDLVSPTCGHPPSKRNRNLREISYEECRHTKVQTYPTTQLLSTTSKEVQKVQPTTKMEGKPSTPQRLITPTKTVFPTTPKHPNPLPQTSFFTEENQLYLYVGIMVVVGIILVSSILFLSNHHIKKRRAKRTTQLYRNTVVRSFPLTRQGTGQSHLYASIPGDDVRDQNSNIEQSTATNNFNSHDCHNVRDSNNLSSMGTSSFSSHDFHICMHHSLEQRNPLSDSQDSGLADQCRNSLHEWIQTNVDISSLSRNNLCCEQCTFYLSIKEGRDSLATNGSSNQQHLTEVISMSDLSPPTHGTGREQPMTSTRLEQPSTSHGVMNPGRGRCNNCHKYRPTERSNRANQMEPGRRKSRKRDPNSSAYVPHNLIT